MRILFTPYGGGSIAHIVRSLAIADTLKADGHELLFTSPTTKKTFIEGAGYDVYGDGHPEVNLNDEHDQSIGYFKKNRPAFIAWLQDEISAAEDFHPDIIVNSPTFFGPIAGHKLNVPHVSIINAQWTGEFKGLLGLSLSEDTLAHGAMRRLSRPIFARQFERVYMEEIRSFYRELKVPFEPKKRVELHSKHPILIPGIPAFEPIYQTPRTDIHYIGPLFWEGFEREPFVPQDIWPDFGSKPFVYVTLGGSIYRKQSYLDLIDALCKRDDWHILLSLGPNVSPHELPSGADHLAIAPYAPGLAVCQYADAVISTGGHGTVMQALWWGKPVIALPHNIDQATIAARLVELKLGRNMNGISLSGFSDRSRYFAQATGISWQAVIATTENVLEDVTLKRGCQTFRARLRAYPHAARLGADLVISYAANYPKSLPSELDELETIMA